MATPVPCGIYYFSKGLEIVYSCILEMRKIFMEHVHEKTEQDFQYTFEGEEKVSIKPVCFYKLLNLEFDTWRNVEGAGGVKGVIIQMPWITTWIFINIVSFSS